MRQIKRLSILIGGSIVLLVGVALMVLPGPAFLVIPAGLAILALEFSWARRWMRCLKAILPLKRKHASPKSASSKRLTQVTPKSVWRSTKFLFRRILHFPKRKPA